MLMAPGIDHPIGVPHPTHGSQGMRWAVGIGLASEGATREGIFAIPSFVLY